MSKSKDNSCICLGKETLYLCDNAPPKAKIVYRINEEGLMVSISGIKGPYRYLNHPGISIPGVTGPFQMKQEAKE